MGCTISVAKKKGADQLCGYRTNTQLMYALVFTYAKSRFSQYVGFSSYFDHNISFLDMTTKLEKEEKSVKCKHHFVQN